MTTKKRLNFITFVQNFNKKYFYKNLTHCFFFFHFSASISTHYLLARDLVKSGRAFYLYYPTITLVS